MRLQRSEVIQKLPAGHSGLIWSQNWSQFKRFEPGPAHKKLKEIGVPRNVISQ